MKRVLSVFLVFATILSMTVIVNTPVFAAQSGDYEYVASGTTAEITRYIGFGGAVTIPDTIGTYKVTRIGDYAFNNNAVITSVIIPLGVISIGDYAFNHCFQMTSATMPNTVTSMETYTFANCHKLSSVTIGSAVKSIDIGTFTDCEALTSVVIPNSLKSIPDYMFDGCYGLKSVIFGSGAASIGKNAFSDCSGFTGVNIPNSVATIGNYAFANCTGLTGAIIGSGVKTMNSGAFQSCTKLMSVLFLGNAPQTYSGVFIYCSSKIRIYYIGGKNGFTNPWGGIPTAVYLSVSPVNDKSTSVSGTAVIGSKISLTVVKTNYSVTPGISGKWTKTLTKKLGIGTKISIKLTFNTFTSSPVNVFVKPTVPTVKKLTKTSKTISGTTYSKAKVLYKINGVWKSINAMSNGSFSIKLAATLKKGSVVVFKVSYKGQTSVEKSVKVA
ncbi:MAG: leucine-rich repeat domain-containing protein [Clostridia bacterium]|jgi:hypothetical protein